MTCEDNIAVSFLGIDFANHVVCLGGHLKTRKGARLLMSLRCTFFMGLKPGT